MWFTIIVTYTLLLNSDICHISYSSELCGFSFIFLKFLIPNYFLWSDFYLSCSPRFFFYQFLRTLYPSQTLSGIVLCLVSRPIVYLELGRMGVVHVQKCAGVLSLAEHLEGQRRLLCYCPLPYSLKNRLSLAEPKAWSLGEAGCPVSSQACLPPPFNAGITDTSSCAQLFIYGSKIQIQALRLKSKCSSSLRHPLRSLLCLLKCVVTCV